MTDLEDLKNTLEFDEHKLSVEELYQRYGTQDEKGLTDAKAAEIFTRDGPNALPPPKTTPQWIRFPKQIFGGLGFFLWFAAILCFLAYSIFEEVSNDYFWLGVVLVVIAFVTGCFSYYQEVKSFKTMQFLKNEMPLLAIVIRDGEKRLMKAEELVVGDVVEIKLGDCIPADIRIIKAQDFKVDNSSLTAETEPQSRTPEFTNENPFETKNLLFFSTVAVEGVCLGLVIRTGDRTMVMRIGGNLSASLEEPDKTAITSEIVPFMNIFTGVIVVLGVLFVSIVFIRGYTWDEAVRVLIDIIVINALRALPGIICLTLVAKLLTKYSPRVRNLKRVGTPMVLDVVHFYHTMTDVAICLSISIFIIAFILGYSWLEAILFFIVITVVTVPEGLLATIHLWLTVTAKRMAKKSCLVKNLKAVERLGSTSVICSSKTGILTVNRMTVAHMWFDNQIFEADTRESQEDATYDKNSPGWRALCRCAMLCNRADFKQDRENLQRPVLQRECYGDPSESALLRCVELSIGNVLKYREQTPKVCEIPFNSTKKYQVSIHETKDGDDRYLLVMKGAPERILERCSTIYIDGTDIELNDYWREAFNRAYLALGSLGERVLGFCDLRLPVREFPRDFQFDVDDVNFPVSNLRFLGLMSMVDPPRVGVAETVAKCRSAGIRVIMVTSDHPITAMPIAKCVGIISEGEETVEDIALRLEIPVHAVNPADAKASVLHGSDLQSMSPDEIDRCLREHPESVFARTTPQQKLTIVESLQHQGAVVTVIGSSVRDLLALRKADTGIVMDSTASDISKQAADIILLDGNFESIVTAIEESRLFIDNFKKPIAYALTSRIPIIISFLIYFITDIPFPFAIITILCLTLATDMVPNILLVFKKSGTDVMRRRARDSKSDRSVISGRLILMAYAQIGIILALVGLFVYFAITSENPVLGLRTSWTSTNVNYIETSHSQKWTYEERQTLEYTCHTTFLVSIVLIQLANLIICQTRSDSLFRQSITIWILNLTLIFVTILAAVFCYTPYLNKDWDIYPFK